MLYLEGQHMTSHCISGALAFQLCCELVFLLIFRTSLSRGSKEVLRLEFRHRLPTSTDTLHFFRMYYANAYVVLRLWHVNHLAAPSVPFYCVL